jgi:cyclopropane-fatty-acyl-phospholipid synthase
LYTILPRQISLALRKIKFLAVIRPGAIAPIDFSQVQEDRKSFKSAYVRVDVTCNFEGEGMRLFLKKNEIAQGMEIAGGNWQGDAREIDHWAQALDELLAVFDGAMAVQLPDSSSGVFGSGARTGAEPAFTLCVRNATAVRTLLLGRDPLRFAEAYFRGDMDVDGDLFAALSLKDYLHALQLPLGRRLVLLLRLLATRAMPQPAPSGVIPAPTHASDVKHHSREENREAISFHYDLSSDFYRLWLGESMVYSCAYFEAPDNTLEQAQFAKLGHICRKLRLAPGEMFLDVGCGWGALVMHAAQHYGVRAHGITLSERQFDLARARIQAAGLSERATVELRDYRDMAGDARFDKIASVGMFEHVGLKNLTLYFDTIQRLLKPHGLFLNHGITHEDEGWGDAISSRFINRYVFPDGELDTVSNIQRVMEHAKFEIVDVEGLRPHYARTLRHWVQRLEQQHAQALEYVNEATFRVWRLYMAACAMEFETGELGVYQILATRRGGRNGSMPLTRRYMYP